MILECHAKCLTLIMLIDQGHCYDMKMHHKSECVGLDRSASAPSGCVYNLPTSIQRMPNLGLPHQYGRKLGRRLLFGDMIYSRFSRYKYIHTDRFNIRHGP